MKNTIQLLILILLSNPLIGQIMDGGFEKWDTAFYWVEPVNSQFEIIPQVWKSNNEIHPDWHPFLVSTPASQSTVSPFNNYSVKLESSASIGIDEGGSGILYQDIPLQSLSEISYWMKCDSLEGVSGCIIEVYGINTNLELIYQDSVYDEQEEFQQFKILSTELNSLNYDSIRLQFRAVGHQGLTSNPLGHSRMYLDEIDAKYITNTVDQRITVELFPNPATSKVLLNSLDHKIIDFKLIDLLGSTVKSQVCNQNKCKLDVADQADGLYYLHMNFAGGKTEIKNLIINHF